MPLNTLSTPLYTKYDGEQSLVFKGRKDSSEDGVVAYLEEYLANPAQTTINGYSCLYLTNKVLGSDIIEFHNIGQTSVRTFCSRLDFLSTGFVVSITGVNAYDYDDTILIDGVTLSDRQLEDTMMEITFTDDEQIQISHVDNNERKFLCFISNTSLTEQSAAKLFYFLPKEDTESELTYTFQYNLDKDLGRLNLFASDTDGNQYIITTTQNLLTAIPFDIDTILLSNYFQVNYYLDIQSPKINSSWVSYEKTGFNKHLIDINRSRMDLENNYLVYTQYSGITGDYLEANVLSLKNQHTIKNNSYRSSYTEITNDFFPNVDCRDYVSMNTGNRQEKSSYNISFGYTVNSIDYKFIADEYTTFKTASSIYPYEVLNVNDTTFIRSGSIAGDSPYNSDKIFRKTGDTYEDSVYVCTWLSAGESGDSLWVDRYFKINTSDSYTELAQLLNQALSSSEYYNTYHLYNSISEEFENTPQTAYSALSGFTYFDKTSDLSFIADREYIYFRLGNEYVTDYLSKMNDNLLLSSYPIKSKNGGNIIDTPVSEYTFDGSGYASFDNYNEINKSNEFTISFDLKSNDWSRGFGHQIFGNLTRDGIGLVSDFKITPFITIQSVNGIHVFNTDFDQVDIATIKVDTVNNKRITDIYRTDHLSPFYGVID